MAIFLTMLTFFIFGCTTTASNYKGHGKGSVSPEELKTYEAREIPAKQAQAIEKALDTRAPGYSLLSPDGTTIYFNWNVTGTYQLWKSARSNAFPIQMTSGNDSVSPQVMSPNGKWLAISRDDAGAEYPGIHLVNLLTDEIRFVTGKDKVNTSAQHFSMDSQKLYYTSNVKGPTIYGFYEYDIATGKSKELFTREGVWWIADYIYDEKWLLGYAKGSVAREYEIYDLKSKKSTPVLGQGEDEYYSMAFGRDEEVVVLTNKLHDFNSLYIWQKDKSLKMLVSFPDMDISSFTLSQDKSRLLYVVNDKGYFKIKGLSLKTNKNIDKNLPEFPGADSISVFAGTPDSRYRLFRVSYTDRPSETWVYDWKTRKKLRWIESSAPEVNLSHIVTPSLETYKSRDGVDIPMFVYRPKTCLKNDCPVIVSFHGGPESQATPYYSVLRNLLLEEGFIFVTPNVRGSRGYGKKWMESDNGAKRLITIYDIEDAALHIKKNWHKSSPQKIGVMGGSYGGYSTLMAMTKFAGTYDAGVSIVGMSSLITFLENTAPFRRQLRVTEYGDPTKDLEALKQLSPITYLDNIKSPLMIIQGANDPRVPAGEAIQMHKAVKSKGIPVELILFGDEGHGISKRQNKVLYYGNLIRFFKTHLMGK